ncbi:MAG TPA: class I SAM-dependent methyltransferase, partial [Melioribacteraceae bacterium]|nr:class I SAM-dependent methyltransferase [Melioribacteraceae bacterium]
GNRKLWGDEHNITAIELNSEIAEIYKELYPNDTVIVADAHQYLLEHFQKYDFIWASPPCPTHSRTNYFLKGKNVFRYPDMTLYQEIILLQHFYKGKWVVENVIPYYEPLIKPTAIINRHYFWSNIYIPERNFDGKQNIEYLSSADTVFGFNLLKYRIKNKPRILRNLVNPIIGEHILKCAINNITNRQEKLEI